MGTGDGTYAYRLARSWPDTLVIGLDSNAENLQEISHKASLKPSKGGLSNLILGQLSLEQSPGEVAGLADSISVILPWGSLLKAMALPEPELLHQLAQLGKPSSEIKIIFGYGLEADAAEIKALGLPDIDVNALRKAYCAAGFDVRVREIPVEEIREIPSKWAKKLAFSGKNRTFVEIKGCCR